MQQQMGSLGAPHVARLPPQLGTADRRSFCSGHGHRLLRTSRIRLDRVPLPALDAVPKSCLLRDAAITARKSRLLDEDAQSVSESNQLQSVRKEDEFFEVEMMVRDDDLDEFKVVNNAIYASYIQRGRDLLLEKLGIKVSHVAATGKAMALSELNLKYFKPLKSGDRFIVKVKPAKITGVRLIVHHIIETLPDRKLVLEAKATAVFLNEDYCPTRVFPELSARVREMFPCMEC
ncbi:hypothetical protein PR202_gb14754 [Eleusine coracana subsp. coracana]|uniref:Thioesterase domain-containing protein n=1 Tax=Eleusine coracana subsp. coracana TaxID=191504 RepID=A0AAV5EW82_ELECO|nr:hypothetical protein QOZ80_4BG0339120 [Eleusine coracana subsp. coracana]GJN26794.1 hypothetical protein PR202_gb14754 [Eleusine coracana subsp. coracana]